MYISVQKILNWNNQYAADRVANCGALTHISADDPRGWIQGPDYVAPVHTLTGQGYASAGNATFGLTDPMTLWAQQQSDSNAVYPEASAPSISAIQDMQSIGSTDSTGSSTASTSDTNTTTYRQNLEKLLLTWASLMVSDTQTSTISAFA
jgi:hypothetical protein